MAHGLLSLHEPHWWQEWQVTAEARLPPAANPFGLASADGTLAGFVLRDIAVHKAQESAQAQGFVNSLAKIQTAQRVAIEYAAEINCSDLLSGQVLLDATLLHACPFRPQATLTERLDILGGLCLHEILHLEYSSVTLCRRAKQRGTLFGAIHNILEDEYIESRLPETCPGYVGYLQATKAYMFGEAHKAMVGQDTSLLNTLLLFVRYPRALHWQDVVPYDRELTQIRAILTPFPASGPAVYRTAERIYQIFQASPHCGSEPTPGLQAFLEAMAHHRTARHGKGRKRGRRAQPPEAPESFDLRGQILWAIPEEHREQYEADRAVVTPYIQFLRQWLQGWEAPVGQPRTGLAQGRLDRRKLHTVPFGDGHIFQRTGKPGARPLTLILLIDESGSMDGAKIAAARQVAILFKEALVSMQHVELYIFGHTADAPPSTTTIFRYWAPGWQRRYSLGSVTAKTNNRDGVALWAVAHEVQRLTRNREIIMLILSDGQPYASQYQGEAAVEHTHTVVKQLQRELVIIQIAIEPVVESARMFDHYVHWTDLAALPINMAQLLRKLLI